MSHKSLSTLSLAEARRVALAAQGFRNVRKIGKRRPFDTALNRLHILQIDSVNVFARSHYLPVFSRHGGYEPPKLDQQLWGSGEFTEYWAHEAAFLPIADRKLFGWRMDDFRNRHMSDGRAEAFSRVISDVRARLRDGGPQLVRELESGPRETRGPWWDWSDTKRAVEMLFAWGEVVSVGREGFQRRYALVEQAVSDEHLESVEREEAQMQLVERAADSLGVATLADLADYHRLKRGEAKAAVQQLEDQGILIPVEVDGWRTSSGAREPTWIHRDARVPSRLAPNALLTPFDPITWFRPRAERLFDFHYRIEIYTPKEQRQFGYYCLPLMVGGKLAGRIDLKADRTNRDLLVQAAWQESAAPAQTAEVARELLAEAAAWQGLDAIRTSGVGNLKLPSIFTPNVRAPE
ncbi:winged helix-turn-helix domain-containing protein [Leucobacter denitrificans]|uniref:YcaQ family DNA glycosylase n=1 Tax=Leucobacter denitrificans TaxID=683042 RepID=A0A7G9S5S6_9MICO|nr:crosslink repair DNA glycosylase YcaQ family protein [Leucobacter denitrificans]QNN63201.1 YcaQ family DNA glycosylase [Leucobacter denitrificans]